MSTASGEQPKPGTVLIFAAQRARPTSDSARDRRAGPFEMPHRIAVLLGRGHRRDPNAWSRTGSFPAPFAVPESVVGRRSGAELVRCPQIARIGARGVGSRQSSMSRSQVSSSLFRRKRSCERACSRSRSRTLLAAA